MKFVNQYSFVISAGILLLIISVATLRGGVSVLRLSIIAGLVIAVALAYSLLNPGSSTLNSIDQIESSIGRGTPVLLEFQSPY